MARHSGIAADQMIATSAAKMTYVATTQSTTIQDVGPVATRSASSVVGAMGLGWSSSRPVVSCMGVRGLTRATANSRLSPPSTFNVTIPQPWNAKTTIESAHGAGQRTQLLYSTY